MSFCRIIPRIASHTVNVNTRLKNKVKVSLLTLFIIPPPCLSVCTSYVVFVHHYTPLDVIVWRNITVWHHCMKLVIEGLWGKNTDKEGPAREGCQCSGVFIFFEMIMIWIWYPMSSNEGHVMQYMEYGSLTQRASVYRGQIFEAIWSILFHHQYNVVLRIGCTRIGQIWCAHF